MRPALALPAALLLLSATTAEADLVLKAFPVGCAVTIDGAPAKPRTVQGALRTFALPRGWFIVGLSAPGYRAREIILEVKGDTPLEAKLEREGSGLALIAEMATGRQPKCVEYTPDGRFILSALLEGPGVDAFDAAMHRKVATLSPPDPWPGSRGFVEIAFLPERGELWVSQMTTGMVHAFRLSDFAYVDSFPAGAGWSRERRTGSSRTAGHARARAAAPSSCPKASACAWSTRARRTRCCCRDCPATDVHAG